jgi:hypothetical protein
LWRLFDERFAEVATGILDFYHAAQNLWKRAAAWLDGRTPRHGGGSRGHGTACGMAIPTGSWATWARPWTWRGCPTPCGTP